jgi:hypothetical protein
VTTWEPETKFALGKARNRPAAPVGRRVHCVQSHVIPECASWLAGRKIVDDAEDNVAERILLAFTFSA